MTAGSQQVVTLYEDNGLRPEEIALQLEVEEEAVRMALLQYSTKYRQILQQDAKEGGEASKTFQTEDYEAAKRVMSSLLGSRDENVALRASKFIINEHKGRHDIAAAQGININVHEFNRVLQQARLAVNFAKRKPLVEVQTSEASV